MKVSVPIYIPANSQVSDNLKPRLIELNAKQVILCLGFQKDISSAKNALVSIKSYAEKISFWGYEVAIWVRTLDVLEKPSYKKLTDFNGKTLNSWKCPLCMEFREDYLSLITEVAKIGIETIILEDDFRLQNTTMNAACFCDEHLKLYSQILKKPVTRELMYEYAFKKGPNEFRDAYLKANSDVLYDFAKQIRSAVDKVNPSIKIRLCCGPTLFGGDGSNPIILADALRNNDGYVEFRLIGAPYWDWMFDVNIKSAVDFARRQAYDCKKHDVTLIGEGDPFPRPRFAVPASDLEFFHTVTLADGNFDGIQKYALDYISNFDYETGYTKSTENNSKLYKKIRRVFSDKKCVGFYPIEPYDCIRYAKRIPDSPEYRVMNSPTRKFLNDTSMPTCFEPGGVNVIFGDNAYNVDKTLLKHGNVIDIEAALILKEQGVDVGLISAQKVIPKNPTHGYSSNTEFYFKYGDKNLILNKSDYFYNLTLKNSATVESELQISNCKDVGSYTYENADSERFLVYNFNAIDAVNNIGQVRNYYRQGQLNDLYEWLNGNKLDFAWTGNPDIYIMCKKSNYALVVGVWNRFSDQTMQPIITLGERYSKVKFTNINGTLDGDKINVSKPLKPYDFAIIELTK